VTRPLALTAAMVLSDEFHTAVLVMSRVLLSEYVATAVSCCVLPFGIANEFGVTLIAVITAGVTVSVVVPLIPEALAVIVVVPTPVVCVKPAVGLLMLIVAALGFEELQFAVLVMSWMVPFVNVPVAVNC
jgi:hypothetical protein